MAVIGSHLQGRLDELGADFRRKMNGILNFYGSWWDAYFARGLLYHFDGEFSKAASTSAEHQRRRARPREDVAGGTR